MNLAQYHSSGCIELLSACGRGDLKDWKLDSSIARVRCKRLCKVEKQA